MFCKNCAEVLTDEDVTCPKCGFAAGTGMKYCGTCGEELLIGAAVCEMCGTPVNSVPGGFAQQPQHFQQAYQSAAQQQTFQQPYAQPQQTQQQPTYAQPNVNQQIYQQQQAFQQQQFQQRSMPPQQQAFQQPYSQGVQPIPVYNVAQQKSKVAAGLLGIFLGALGVHNFYLGYTGKAVIQLLLTLLSCGTLGIISEIWGLVEGIQLLTGSINTDAKGIPLKD